MQKSLIVVLLFISSIGIGQVIPVPDYRVPNNSTQFGVNIPVGATVYDISAGKKYNCITAALSSETLTSASAKFTEIPTGTGWVPSTRTISTTSPLVGGGDLSANRTLSMSQANGSTSGYLSSTDWNTFNGKQSAYTNLTSIGGLANSSGWLKNNGSGTFTYSTPTYSDVGAAASGHNHSGVYEPSMGTKSTGFAKWNGSAWVWDNSNYQNASVVLGAISNLSPASGWLKNDGSNNVSWSTPTASDVGAAASSHAHGNITSAGAIGSTASLPIITTTSGVLTTGSFGSSSGTFAEGNHTHSGFEPAITKSTGYAKWTGSAWSFVNETYSLSSHTHPAQDSIKNPWYYNGGYIKPRTTGRIEASIGIEVNANSSYSLALNAKGMTIGAGGAIDFGSGNSRIIDGSGSYYLAFHGWNGSAVGERMRMTGVGYFGIGTTNPSTALDVNGVVTATGGNSTNWNTAYSHSQASHQTIINGTGFVKASGTTLSYDNSTYSLSSHNHTGTYLTSVSGTSPISSSGGMTPAISISNAAADGSTKGAASFTANDFDASSGNISIDYLNGQAASGSAKGFLTSTDWTTFNNKVSNATHTGDATGSTVLTLATVNSNVGTYNNITINAKGLATAGSNVAYLTGNQTITLGGILSGSGSTSITASAASGYYMPTTTDQSTWNGKQAAYTNLTSIGGLANSSGWLKNNGSGTFSYSTPTYTEVGAAASSHTHGNITNAGYIGTTATLPIITGTGGILQAGSFGTGAGTFCQGNDSRLSDARTPTAHVLNSSSHTVSGLTTGHFLKATSATTFGFAAHGLTYTDVGAAASGHNHSGVYEPANANIQSHISSTSNPHSVTKSQVGLGSVENTALSTWTGSTNITTLGTIATGVWNGTAIGYTKGGTGLTTLGTAGQSIRVNSGATGYEFYTPSTGGGSTKYVGTITSATTGTITAATHGCGTSPMVQVYETISTVNHLIVVDVQVNASGDVTWTSNSAISGKIIIL